jgi:hypothetical protein
MVIFLGGAYSPRKYKRDISSNLPTDNPIIEIGRGIGE